MANLEPTTAIPTPVEPVPERQPAHPSPPEKIELSVREVLRDLPQDRLGFDPSRVPGDVTARFPLTLIKPQLATGRVVVSLSSVVEGCAEKYRPAFAKADLECKVTLPLDSIFHQLPVEGAPPSAPPAAFVPVPEPAPPLAPSFTSAPSPFTAAPSPAASAPEPVAPAPAPAAPSPFGFAAPAPAPIPQTVGPPPDGGGVPAFETPFSAPAAKDADMASPPLAPTVETPSQFGPPSFEVPAVPAAAVPQEKPSSLWDTPVAPAAVAAPESASPAFAGLPPLGALQASPPPASAPPSGDFPFLSDSDVEEEPPLARPASAWETAVPTGVAPSFSGFEAPAFEDDEEVESFESLGNGLEAVPEPKPEAECQSPEAGGADETSDETTYEPATGFQTATFSENKEQQALRALFMSDERFDAKAVVRHCRALPGIDGCVLLSEDGEIRAGSGDEGEGFAAKASTMLSSVISLASALGLSDAENFSMRTDKGMVSFFKASPVYLGVQHSNRGFLPGVQEKLALASSELAGMADS